MNNAVCWKLRFLTLYYSIRSFKSTDAGVTLRQISVPMMYKKSPPVKSLNQLTPAASPTACGLGAGRLSLLQQPRPSLPKAPLKDSQAVRALRLAPASPLASRHAPYSPLAPPSDAGAQVTPPRSANSRRRWWGCPSPPMQEGLALWVPPLLGAQDGKWRRRRRRRI